MEKQPNLSTNSPLSRLKTLKRLNGLIEVATFRIGYKYTPNRERLAWARVLVSAASAAGPLLRDQDLEELQVRLDALEKAAAEKRRRG